MILEAFQSFGASPPEAGDKRKNRQSLESGLRRFLELCIGTSIATLPHDKKLPQFYLKR
jgi:hypothetical protein